MPDDLPSTPQPPASQTTRIDRYGRRLRTHRPAPVGSARYRIPIAAGALALLILLILVLSGDLPGQAHLTLHNNQRAALRTVRAIAAAESKYRATYPAIGYSCSLQSLGGLAKEGAPSTQRAQLIPADLADTSSASGYLFAITGCNQVAAPNNSVTSTIYRLTAVPEIPGKTGDNAFCTDQTNTITIDPNGRTNCTERLP